MTVYGCFRNTLWIACFFIQTCSISKKKQSSNLISVVSPKIVNSFLVSFHSYKRSVIVFLPVIGEIVSKSLQMKFYLQARWKKVEYFPTSLKAAQPLWKWARLCASHGRRRRSGCVGSHAGVGAAEDFPIKTGKPREHELIHRREESRLRTTVPRNEPEPQPKEFECMVGTDAPARMSRTEEVHRITENVYKVRGTLRWWMSPQRDTCCTW